MYFAKVSTICALFQLMLNFQSGNARLFKRLRCLFYRSPQSPFSFSVVYKDFSFLERCTLRKYFDRWLPIIRDDLPDGTVSSEGRDPTACGTLPTIVDDIFVCLATERIDGPGGVLARGVPLLFRENDPAKRPGVAEIIIDSSDYESLRDSGLLKDVMLREIGHMLGIGTRWVDRGITQAPNPSCEYGAPAVNREWRLLSGCTTSVPLEQTTTSQNYCTAWDNDCLANELMTSGSITGSRKLSRLTVAALDDLGYEVNYAGASAFSSSDVNPNCRCSGRRRLSTLGANETTHHLSSEGYFKAHESGIQYLSQRGAESRYVESQEPNDGWVAIQNYTRVHYQEDGNVFVVHVWLD